MSGIICAVRGGPPSRPTIAAAIDLAVKATLPLYFLFIVNLDFLSHAGSSHLESVESELRAMGELILLGAQQQATQRGVPAKIVVREGQVDQEIVALTQELGAEYVILGSPAEEGGETTLSGDAFQQLIDRIETETAAHVVLARASGS